jgi:hypothetical protein
MSVTVDGVEQHDRAIPLVDDRQEHYVEVKLHTEQLFGSEPDKIAPAKTEQS